MDNCVPRTETTRTVVFNTVMINWKINTCTVYCEICGVFKSGLYIYNKTLKTRTEIADGQTSKFRQKRIHPVAPCTYQNTLDEKDK